MTKRVQMYVAAIHALGVTIAAACLSDPSRPADLFLVAALVLCALISTQKLRIPGMEGTLSGGFAFILLSIGKLGAEETVLMAMVAALVQSLWRCARRPQWYQVTFNVAALVSCAWFTHHAVHVLIPGSAPFAVVAQLCVAAMLLLVLNTFLVAVVLWLIEGGGLSVLWSRCRFWALPYYLAGAALASGILVGTAAGPAWTSLLLAPAITLVSGYYRQYVEMQQELSSSRS